MSKTISERFLHCLELLKDNNSVKSDRQFAMSLGFAPQSLNALRRGSRKVTLELCQKAVCTYNFNPKYILCGEGSPMEDSTQAATTQRVLTIITDKENEEKIVHVPVSAQAGYGGNLSSQEFLSDLQSYNLPGDFFKYGTFRSFDISGDSMEPTIYNGDKIVCSFIEPENWTKNIRDNFVYIVVTNNDVVIKRVKNKILEANCLELHSDNDYYQPYSIPIEEIKEIWTAKVKISPLMNSPVHLRNSLYNEVDNLRTTIADQSALIKGLNSTIEMMLKQNRARN